MAENSGRMLETVHISPHVIYAVLTQEALNPFIECMSGLLAAERLSITLNSARSSRSSMSDSSWQHPGRLLRGASRLPRRCSVVQTSAPGAQKRRTNALPPPTVFADRTACDLRHDISSILKRPPFRPDTRHNLEGLRLSSSTGGKVVVMRSNLRWCSDGFEILLLER
jgi:hypothetical protein